MCDSEIVMNVRKIFCKLMLAYAGITLALASGSMGKEVIEHSNVTPLNVAFIIGGIVASSIFLQQAMKN
jgi:hypothetical protein